MICKYFLEGRCKFGSSCRDEHRQPYAGSHRYNEPRYNNSQQRVDIYNRIGFTPGSGNPRNQPNGKLYDEKSVRIDLTKDRPIYRYSVYGPAKEEPNLIDGTDYSPEELRLQYYTIMGTYGNDLTYQNGVKDLENRTQEKFDSTLKTLRNAINRFETQKQQQSGFGSFGNGNGTFGQPQVQGFGAPQSTFGSYNISQSSTHTFGAPSAFGQNTIGFPVSNPNNTSGFGATALGNFDNQNQIAGGFGTSASTFGGFGQQSQPQPQPQPDPQQIYQQQILRQQELYAQQQMLQQPQSSQLMEVHQPGVNTEMNNMGQTNIAQWPETGFSAQSTQKDWEMYQVPERPPTQG